jgi:hypothetical protein
LPASI